MHLSLLSDAYLSDSLDDAGSASREVARAPSHFAALCRGLAVVAALSLPIGLTLFAQAAPAEDAQARNAQTHGVHGLR